MLRTKIYKIAGAGGASVVFSFIFCFVFFMIAEGGAEEGIVGCWNFGEGQGDTVKDSSGNKNDGKIHGASWAKEDITDAMKVQGGTWAGDEFISVLRFNGTSNYIDCGNDKSLMPENAMTVEAWLKMPNKGGCILNKRADKDGYILETNAGKISFTINPWAGSLRGNTDIITGNWSHVAGTYDGSSVKVYVNGALDGSLEYKSSINPNVSNLIIGYRGSAPDSDYFNGIIGGVKIYSRALSAEEISKHFSEDPRSKKIKVAEKVSSEDVESKYKELKDIETNLNSIITEAKKKGINTQIPEIRLTVMKLFPALDREDYKISDHIANRNLNYLIDRGKETINILKEIISGKTSQPYSWTLPKPDMDMSKVIIKGGNLYVGDRPIFIFAPNIGFTSDSFVKKRDFPVMSPLNLNGFITDVNIHDVGQSEDKWNSLNGLNSNLSNIFIPITRDVPDYNLCILLHLYPQANPDAWRNLSKEYPDILIPAPSKIFNNNQAYVRVDHYAVRTALKKIFEDIIPRLKNIPAFRSYTIDHEPYYFDFNNFTDYDLDKFHVWLIEKYNKNIDSLNKVWNTSYPDFKDINFPPDSEKMAVTQYADLKKYRYWENRAMWYDWLTFNEERYTDFIKWRKDTIKKIDPKTLIYIGVNGPNVFKEVSNRASNNIEEWLEISEICGFDLGVYPPEITEDVNYAFDCKLQSKVLDLYKSLYPEKPAFNTEWHFTSHVEWPSKEYVRTAMWEAVLHGQSSGALFSWMGHWYEGQWGLLVQSEALESIGETSLELQMLAPYIIEFPKAKREVALLYSNPSILQSAADGYPKELDTVYEGISFLDTPVGFISEKQISAGEFKDYKLLIIPKADYVKETTYQAIKKHIFSGGTALIVSDSLRYDEYGHPREVSELLGKNGKNTEFPKIKTVIEVVNYGKGIVYIARGSLTQVEYAEVADMIMNKVGVNREIRVSKEFSRIESRTVVMNGKRVTYIINMNRDKTVKIRLESPTGKIVRIKDLITGREIKNTEIESVPMCPLFLEMELEKKGY